MATKFLARLSSFSFNPSSSFDIYLPPFSRLISHLSTLSNQSTFRFPRLVDAHLGLGRHSIEAGAESKRKNYEFIPRRSIWKGPFVDAFLLRMKQKRDPLLNKKIWSRRSSIFPEFVNGSVRIYNGKTFVRCKITEGKVGHKFGEFAFTRKRRLSRTNIQQGKSIQKGKKRGRS